MGPPLGASVSDFSSSGLLQDAPGVGPSKGQAKQQSEMQVPEHLA